MGNSSSSSSSSSSARPDHVIAATQSDGLRHGGLAGLSRRELMQQGLTATQAEHILILQHEEEFMASIFARWLSCFACWACFLYSLCLVLLVVLVAEWCHYARSLWFWRWGEPGAFEPACNVPVKLWTIVFFTLCVLSVFKSSIMCKRLLSCFCRWPMDESRAHGPTPWRIRVIRIFWPALLVVWDVLGLYWAGQADAQCSKHHSGLLRAVIGFCASHLALALVIYLNVVGLAAFLRWLVRAGLVRSPQAAPRGSLEASTVPIKVGSDGDVDDSSACPICLESFGGKMPAVQTRSCGHAFHRQCLGRWLDVNRHCPLCRQDLTLPQTGA
mmetsp:Transcript_112627/g.218239  ORF Transcript_112627/g.218239 Transcript_112627/m.218239 type:complete len:329 (+) Transcript_112627:996-1982(+)